MRSGIDQRGSALVETAILLPIYSLLCVGVIYFGNTILLHQEVNLSARYQSTGTSRPGSGAPAFDDRQFLPSTGGQALPDAWFIQFSGDIDMSNSRPTADSADPYTDSWIYEELVKVSWDITRSFDVNGVETTTTGYSPVGTRIYRENILLDAPAIADRLNGWFRRQRFRYDVTHQSGLYQTEWGHTSSWALAGLPEPVIDTTVAAAARTGSARSAPTPSTQSPKPIESTLIGDGSLFVETFDDYDDGGFNTTPSGKYPDYEDHESFWVPN